MSGNESVEFVGEPTIIETEYGLLVIDDELAGKLHAAFDNRWRRSWKPNLLRSTQIVGGRRDLVSVRSAYGFLSFCSGSKGRLALRGYRQRKHRYSLSRVGGATVVHGL